jgi:hypothetical protein
MVATMVFERLSSTPSEWIVPRSLKMLTYSLRPSGAKLRNRGGPAATGIVAVTWFVAVSTTVMLCASRLAV